MGENRGAGAARPGRGGGWLWAAGAAAGLAVGAAVWLLTLGPKAPPPAPAEVPATVSPEAAEPAAPAPAAPVPAAEEGIAALGFDVVRSEPDGSVVVAGRAAPGQEVIVSVNGQEAARATADAQGKFAAFLTLPAGDKPHLVTLSAKDAGGKAVASEETVILEPVAPSAGVAAADAAAPAAGQTAPEAAMPAEPEVAAPAAAPAQEPDVLVADAEGVRKLAAGATDTVVIDTISYDAAGNVTIAGRAAAPADGQPAGAVRLYLDNAGAAMAPVAQDGGWSAVLTGIAPGLYTLRADHVDAAGKVVSRIETPFLREAPEVVASAAPAAAPGATAEMPAEVAGEAPAAAAPEAEAPAGGTATPAAPAEPAAATTAPAEAAPAPAVTGATIVTVQPGFTLWRIARESYGSGFLYVKVFEANKDQIRDPDLIYPGQVFTVPAE